MKYVIIGGVAAVAERRALPTGVDGGALGDRPLPGRVVVVGAGFIGLEVAESLRQRGFDVTVGGRPLRADSDGVAVGPFVRGTSFCVAR